MARRAAGHHTVSQATRDKISAALKGRPHPHKGHPMSAAARAKISAALRARNAAKHAAALQRKAEAHARKIARHEAALAKRALHAQQVAARKLARAQHHAEVVAARLARHEAMLARRAAAAARRAARRHVTHHGPHTGRAGVHTTHRAHGQRQTAPHRKRRTGRQGIKRYHAVGKHRSAFRLISSTAGMHHHRTGWLRAKRRTHHKGRLKHVRHHRMHRVWRRRRL